MRAVSTAAGLLALIAPSASAAAWRPPQAVAYDGFTNALNDFSGFLSTRDGSRVDIVTLRELKGIVVVPVLANGRLGKGTRLPASRNAEYPWEDPQAEFAADGQYPNAAVNQGGLVAVAWRTMTSVNSFSEQPCFCQIRVDVGIPGHHFSSIVLSRKSRTSKEILSVQISRTGRVRVLYAVGTGEHDLVLAEIDKPWKTAHRRALGLTAQPFGQSPDYAMLAETAEREEILVEGQSELRLAREPFSALSRTGLAWPPGEGLATENHILLSAPRGLVIGVVANRQSDALEVAKASATGPFAQLHPVLAPLPATSSQQGCSLGGAINDRGETLVAWRCPDKQAHDAVHAALLDPEGRVTALSSVGEPGEYARSRPAVWLDDAGHGIVAEEGLPYRDLLLDRQHFSQWGSLLHGANDGQATVAVATTPGGLGLATWAEESRGRVPWSERLELDEIEIGLGPGETSEAQG